jgi:predicted nucleic acid-binding protein
MIYLDTGCLLKLYYPEPESESVAKLVVEEAIVLVALHELELANALELKLFRREAKLSQVRAVHEFVAADLRDGKLHRPALVWDDVLQDSTALARSHTRKLGCRSLDILHCAAARRLAVDMFVTTDARQKRLANAIGLRCVSL